MVFQKISLDYAMDPFVGARETIEVHSPGVALNYVVGRRSEIHGKGDEKE